MFLQITFLNLFELFCASFCDSLLTKVSHQRIFRRSTSTSCQLSTTFNQRHKNDRRNVPLGSHSDTQTFEIYCLRAYWHALALQNQRTFQHKAKPHKSHNIKQKHAIPYSAHSFFQQHNHFTNKCNHQNQKQCSPMLVSQMVMIWQSIAQSQWWRSMFEYPDILVDPVHVLVS